MALTFFFTAAAARELNGERSGAVAVLLLLGCFGLVVRSHQIITDVAMLTGFAMAYYGCALALRRASAGGFLIGTGAGIGFLANGIVAPAIIIAMALLLPAAGRGWGSRGFSGAPGVAAPPAGPPLLLLAHPLF